MLVVVIFAADDDSFAAVIQMLQVGEKCLKKAQSAAACWLQAVTEDGLRNHRHRQMLTMAQNAPLFGFDTQRANAALDGIKMLSKLRPAVLGNSNGQHIDHH